MVESQSLLTCVPLTRDTYKPYGDVISADEALPYKPANMGRAKRFDSLSEVENLRPESAQLNLCIFRCAPVQLPLEIGLLERHEHSTQVFLPMSQDAKFLVIVSLGQDTPDLDTLKVFVVDGPQGISYKPGVWHYPMAALDNQVDFACLVWEDGTRADCEIFNLASAIKVIL